MLEVKLQTEDFAVGEEYQRLCQSGAGAVVFFVGRVRPDGGEDPVEALELEHYPAMTQSMLESIVQSAQARFSAQAITVVHRVGYLPVDSQIVFVGVAASHRASAFDGAQYVMDYLKTRAPFWKKEHRPSGARWVEFKDSDARSAERWQGQ